MELILNVVLLPLEILAELLVQNYELGPPTIGVLKVVPAIFVTDSHLARNLVGLIQFNQVRELV